MATKRSTRGTTATATHEDVGLDDTDSGGENRTKPLKTKAVKLQLFRAPPGSRVKIETKKFGKRFQWANQNGQVAQSLK